MTAPKPETIDGEMLTILKIIVARADPADNFLREPIATARGIIARVEGNNP